MRNKVVKFLITLMTVMGIVPSFAEDVEYDFALMKEMAELCETYVQNFEKNKEKLEENNKIILGWISDIENCIGTK